MKRGTDVYTICGAPWSINVGHFGSCDVQKENKVPKKISTPTWTQRKNEGALNKKSCGCLRKKAGRNYVLKKE